RADVVASLRGDPALSDEGRSVALELAQEWEEDPHQIARAARALSVSPDGKAEDYARAVRGFEFACRMVPGRGAYLNGLGVSQDRTGRYREALDSLQESERRMDEQRPSRGGASPSGLAFEAMAHFQLQQLDEARQTLGRLRERMKHPLLMFDDQANAFLHEAEALIEGPPAQDAPAK